MEETIAAQVKRIKKLFVEKGTRVLLSFFSEYQVPVIFSVMNS